jgi:hypothetical protein
MDYMVDCENSFLEMPISWRSWPDPAGSLSGVAVRRRNVIPFFAKTWFLWWLLADVLVLYLLHALFARNKAKDMDRLARESEEEAVYIASWQLLRKARAISLSLLGADR